MKFYFVILLLAFPLVSCLEDPKLVKKRDEQQVEIIKLTQELQTLTEKVKNLPEDASAQLSAAKQEVAAQEETLASLEQDISQLKKKNTTLQSEFDAYRVKYPLK